MILVVENCFVSIRDIRIVVVLFVSFCFIIFISFLPSSVLVPREQDRHIGSMNLMAVGYHDGYGFQKWAEESQMGRQVKHIRISIR